MGENTLEYAHMGRFPRPTHHHSHWVRDVTFDSDQSQVRCGNLPQVMVAFRDTVIGLLRWAGYPHISTITRHF
jgi:hypothetical protein